MRPPSCKHLLALFTVFALLLTACGSETEDESTATDGSAEPTDEAGSTDTEDSEDSEEDVAAPATGDAVPVGVLHSLSGTMAISETAVRDSTLLAINEINENGGVLGMQIEPIVEDGASDWPTFAERAEKLITTDEAAVVFGGWTSASRKAMLPVFEGTGGLLFYPVQYEGLEQSPNIFYTGATTNQQIIPALDYMVEEGLTDVYLVGSDYVFPRTANKIIQAYADANGLNILGEDYLPLGDTNVATIVSNVVSSEADIVFNTLNGDSNVAFFKELTAKGNTSEQIQSMSVSVAEEEIAGIGIDNIEGHLVSWNYYQTTDLPRNDEFVEAFKAEYGEDRVTADPIEAGYNSVYIWAAAVEKAGTFEVEAVREAAVGLELDTPEGLLTVDDNQHVYKTNRIGVIRDVGVIEEVWNSGEPIEPDPCLANYEWAEGLAQGECG